MAAKTYKGAEQQLSNSLTCQPARSSRNASDVLEPIRAANLQTPKLAAESDKQPCHGPQPTGKARKSLKHLAKVALDPALKQRKTS